MNPTNDRDAILATARELFGKLVYSHKVHEIERELWSAKVGRMNNINIALAGATTLFAIISASLQPTWAMIITALFAAATICFVMWQSNLDPAGKESQQRVAAKEMLWIREQLLLLITNCHISTIPEEHLNKNLEMITRELTAAYKFAPNTSPGAFKRADAEIKRGQVSFSDREIDLMLPVAFRKSPLDS